MLLRWLLPLAAALLSATVVVAQSPCDSPLHWGQCRDGQTAQPGQKPSANERGTKDNPVVVDIVPPPEAKTKAEQAAHDEHEKAVREKHLVIGTYAIALFTFFLFAGTAGLAIFTYRLWKTTRDLATDAKNSSSEQIELARDTAQRQLRAFVYASGIEEFPEFYANNPTLIHWRVRPVWKNSGSTPTRNLRLFSDCEITTSPLPPGFDFNQLRHRPGTGLLGPNYSSMGGLAPDPRKPAISPQDILDVQQGRKFIYVWGWARYRTVFPKSEEHITRFCWSISVIGNPLSCKVGVPPGHPRRLVFGYAHHDEGNCADDECAALS